MRKIISILWIILVGLSVSAQSRLTVSGQVKEKDAAIGVPYALIRINQAVISADESGVFSVEVPRADEYEFEVSQIGFETLIKKIRPEELNAVELELSSKTIFLEEVLVNGRTHFSQPQSDVHFDPSRAVTQARDVGDLFRGVPGFSTVKKGGFSLDPVFRSFKYEQLNLIYDGGVVATHACPGRMDPATTHINPQDVEKIELIRGPFSMRYGPGMGATINVVTETPDHKGQAGFGGSVEGGFESNGNNKLTKLSLYHTGRQTDLSLSGGIKDFGNYRSGDQTIIPSSFRAYDYNLKAGYDLSSRQRLQVNWRQSFHRDILHAGLAMDTDEDNSSFFSIDYRARQLNAKLNSVNIKAYGTRVDHVMSNRRRPNFGMVEAVAEVVAETYGGKAELHWIPSSKTSIYTGLDLRLIRRSGDRTRLIKRNMMSGEPLDVPMQMTDAIWQDGHIENGGLYVESRFFPSAKWSFLLGGRIDRVSAGIRNPAVNFAALYPDPDQRNEWNMSATASATYTSSGRWDFQLAVGRGVRTASMIERYINHFTVGMDAYEYVGNPNLRPEANHQIEWSVGKEADSWRVNANLYYSLIRNYITAAVDTSLARKYMGSLPYARRFTNIDAAEQYGMELSGSLEIVADLMVNADLAYVRAHNLDWNEPLPEIQPLQLNLGLRYERKLWWVDLQNRWVDEQNRISLSFDESETPGFVVVDLRAGLEPATGLSLGMAVQNMLDRQYREHLSRAYRNSAQPGIIFEPGRNLTFFIKYDF